MSTVSDLPRAAKPFVEFAGILRANGFAIAPEQTENFIAAVGVLGPKSMQDIRRSAIATLAPPPERHDEFEALFRMVFLGQTLAAPARSDGDEEELQAFDDRDGSMEPPEAEDLHESGSEAARTEMLSVRRFAALDEADALRQFRRRAPHDLPKRRSRRLVAGKSGARTDMRRALRDAVKRDGEVLQLPALVRKTRQRRVLLLIDISGSMKSQTDTYLRFAHALARASERLEVFTIGTRLTRVTRALRHANRDQALETASTLVADWDGGTRLGDALSAFLAVPRFAAFARGALVVVLSDGLERGDATAMREAVERLSRHAWAILWLSPLAGDAEYVPQTEALQAVIPFIDRLGDGSTAPSLCREVLVFAARAA